ARPRKNSAKKCELVPHALRSRSMTRTLVAAALAALCGCGAPPRSWRFPARTYAASSARPPRPRAARPTPHAPAVALVERALHERRDAQGRVRNTFLRPKRPDDPPQARYFAGDMLCAVVRPRR